MTDFRQREITPYIRKALKVMPVVVISGLRQTGKSTLLQYDAAFQERRYYSLDDFAILEAARRDPDGLLAGKEPLTIDEAQRCPDLLLAIKRAVDRDRAPGRFILSGSANFSLLKGVADSLAGRAIYLALHPFSFREIHNRVRERPFLVDLMDNPDDCNEKDLPPVRARDVLTGGMPSVCLTDGSGASLWFKGYEQTYLQRDVRDLMQVADIVGFRNLLKLAVLRSGQLLNISELGRDAKLSSATATRYLAVSETSFLLRRLYPYLSNRTSRLVKAPKVFCADSGLACHLAGVLRLEAGEDEPLRGVMFETWFLQNLLSVMEAHAPDSEVRFWAVQGRHEVDLVVVRGRDVVAIEVKSGSLWRERDVSGLRAFLDATPACRLAILAYNGSTTVRIDKKIIAIPLSRLVL